MKTFSAFPAALKLVMPLAAGAALAGAIAWGASRGGGPERASQAQAAMPTPVVEKTPGPLWDPARPDCPQGWRVYNDPDGHFSLCHPPSLYTTTGPGVPGGGQVFVVRNFPGYGAGTPIPSPLPTAVPSGFRVTVYWRPTLPTAGGKKDPCELNRDVTHLPFVRVPTVIAGKGVTICQSLGENEEAGVEPFVAWIPRGANQGFVQVSSSRSGPEAPQNKRLVEQIVSTLRVP